MTIDPGNGNRTHEPSLRELTAELDGLRDLLLEKVQNVRGLIDERDKLYRERDESRRTAVDAALSAAKEQTKASFDASEKAIVKAEEAQKSYNQSHNDLARKMDDQNKATMPRPETQARFTAIEEKVNEVREALAIGGGRGEGGRAVKDEGRANLAAFIAVLVALISAVGMVLMFVRVLR